MDDASVEDNEEYYIDYSKSFRKSIVLYKLQGSVATPIVYFTKPKYIKEEDFVKFIKSLSIRVKKQ